MNLSESNFKLVDFRIGEYPDLSVNHLLYLNYVEDIRSASIRMEVQITDSQTGLVSSLQGMEPVFIGFEDHKGNAIANYMIIYDIQDRVTKGGSSKATLLLCTPDLINNAAVKLSKRLGKGGGEKISKIVEEDLLQKLLSTGLSTEGRIEETANKISFISPFWAPFTIIKWLCSKAISAESAGGKNASAGYCFFQNNFGYNFKSYDSFTREKPVRKIVVGHQPEETEEVETKNILPVDKMTVRKSSDVLRGLNMGSYANNVMTLDVKDMKYEEFPFNINKYYQDVPLMNKNYSVPEYYKKFDKSTAPTRYMSKVLDTALFTEGTYTAGMTAQISQAALREKLFYNKEVEVEYVGTNEMTVGMVVELMVFKGKEQDLDIQNSGKYVVGRVQRQFLTKNNQMSTKLTLFTDSPGSEQTKTSDMTEDNTGIVG